MFKSLKSLGKNPTPQELHRALLELYRFSFALVVVPVLVLSFIFVRGYIPTDTAALIYLGICALLCAVALYLAEKPSSLEKPIQTAFQRAMRLALVPALPAVFFAVTCLHPWAGKVLSASSMILYLLLLFRIKDYSQLKAPENPVLEGEGARAES